MVVEPSDRLTNSPKLTVSRLSIRTRRYIAYFLLACTCGSLTGYILFFRHAIFQIEGERPVPIEAFGDGATVTHAFLMDGDGLRAISVRIVADQPLSLRVVYKLLRLYDPAPGAENNPNLYTATYAWTGTLSLRAGDQWQRIEFPSVGKSHDRWYGFEIRLLDATNLARRPAQSPRPSVRVMASEDNPPRGGKLWINGVRQHGALFIRAHAGTIYEQFMLGDSVFWRDHPLVPVIVVGVAWAFFHLLMRIRYVFSNTPTEESRSPAEEEITRGERLLVLALILAFLGINVSSMTRGLEYDELFTASQFVIGMSLWKTATSARAFNNHVAYSLLAGLTTRIFGPAEWALRLPALALGAATIYFAWDFARSVSDRSVALFSAVVLALSPSFNHWSCSARGYTGLALMTLVSSRAFLNMLKTTSASATVRHVGATVAAIYFHLYGAWVFVIQYLIFGWLVLTRATAHREAARDSGHLKQRGLRALWRSFSIIATLTTMLYLPTFALLTQSTIERGRTGLRLSLLSDLFQAFVSTESWLLGIAVVTVAILGVVRLSRRTLEVAYLLALLLVPLLVMWLLVRPFDLYVRFFAYWTPVFALFVAHGIAKILGWRFAPISGKRGWLGGRAANALILGLVWGIGGLIAADWVKQDLRRPYVAGYREALQRSFGNASASVFAIGGNAEMFDYYLGKPLTILSSARDLERLMAEKAALRIAYHNMPWNSLEDKHMASLLEKQCAAAQRGTVIVFECNRKSD
jgi:hypothetical protein